MKFGDIFPLLLVLLILYYAAMIAMDLYKAKLEKEAEKEKNTEEDIDISDEAANFQPIRITRDDPKKTKSAAPDTTAENAESGNAESEVDNSKENKPKSEHQAPASEGKPDETAAKTPDAPASDAKEETVKTNPYDPSNWEIPNEILQERHHKEHETDDEVSRQKAATSESVVNIAPPTLHEPIMDGGLLIEDIYELANNVAEQENADLQNIVMKCESD